MLIRSGGKGLSSIVSLYVKDFINGSDFSTIAPAHSHSFLLIVILFFLPTATGLWSLSLVNLTKFVVGFLLPL